MPDGCVTGRHRLTVHADLPSQASSDARFGVGELDALGANPAGPTHEAALRIDERDMMRRPRQVVPRPLSARSHATRASTTATTGVPAHARRSIRIVSRLSSASSIVTTRNPDKPRIHVQSRRDPTGPPLLVAHQERTPSHSGWPRGIALLRPGRRADRPPQVRSAQVAGSLPF
jgi:hypothetical protein